MSIAAGVLRSGPPISISSTGDLLLRNAVVTFALALALLVPRAGAAQELSALLDVARAADRVLLATCIRSDSYVDAEHGIIITRVTLRAERDLKGRGDATVTVHTLGGTVGTHGMGAAHSATFSVGQEAVVFLRRSAYGPYSVVVGGPQGVLPVVRDAGGGTGAGVDVEQIDAWLKATGASE